MVSIAIFVATGVLGQLLPLIEAWRKLLATLRGADETDASVDSEPTPQHGSAETPTADPTQMRAGGSTVEEERRDDVDSAAPTSTSHQ
ncbi:hypothetical protein ACQ86F_25380 [Streptomyces venezuelae ATCC 10712]